MKEILCFGDSNTWGYDPRDKGRYGHGARWTSLLQRNLGQAYRVIEEGLNGRTTVWNDPVEGEKNGFDHLGPCLESHKPLDLVIIMLGTNDLKQRFSVPASDIARSAGRLVEKVQKSTTGREDTAPATLLICPPPLARLSELAEMFEGGVRKSKGLAKHFQAKAEELGCFFSDAGSVIKTSNIDGVHWEPDQHVRFAEALKEKILSILNL